MSGDRLAICPECREGRHVYCLDDGTTTWTDRCKCECGDTRPDGRPNLKLARLDSGATEEGPNHQVWCASLSWFDEARGQCDCGAAEEDA